MKPHLPLRKTVTQLVYETAKPELREVRTFAKQLVEMFPFPYLTTVIQRPGSRIT
jgi:hypothetical protein